MKIEMIRSTYWRGELLEAGHVVDIAEKDAFEFISIGRAKKYDAPIAKEVAPPAPVIESNRAVGIDDNQPMAKRKPKWPSKV
jgi:hypothetical protein